MDCCGSVHADSTPSCPSSLESKLYKAAQTLKNGGIIICPTEGVYGISALASNISAVERIIHIKHRALNKGLIVVASNIEMCHNLVDFSVLSVESRQLLNSKWPGHATFIVPCRSEVSSTLTGQRKTIALRVTAFPLLAKLCSLVGEPIVSTSANISGSEPLKTISKLQEVFAQEVDYILDEPCQGLNKPSTIYDAVTGQVLRA